MINKGCLVLLFVFFQYVLHSISQQEHSLRGLTRTFTITRRELSMYMPFPVHLGPRTWYSTHGKANSPHAGKTEEGPKSSWPSWLEK